ncbi:MAG: MBL fold metallo-hydrolase, partial [Actinomycetia bacterium]|nr:MBL fold metallo-hydrolase [Actinomycetes bacterium]
MGNTDDWAKPGAHPVTGRIFRIPLPVPTTGTRAVNVFAIDTDDSIVLIDGGWAHHAARAQLEDSLTSIGRNVRDVE